MSNDGTCTYKALKDDPRLDPALRDAFEPLQMLNSLPPPAFTVSDPLPKRLEAIAETEKQISGLYQHFAPKTLPPEGSVEQSKERIVGSDKIDLDLYIYTPASVKAAEKPPTVMIHIHGGGMSILDSEDMQAVDSRFAVDTGFVFISPDFRNSAGKKGRFTFPAGVNDCVSALQWALSQRKERGWGKILVAGASGGGNLAMAVPIKCKQEGLPQADGYYLMCPYVDGEYANMSEFPSRPENDGYFVICATLDAVASVYVDESHKLTPEELAVAWPLKARKQDLEGLPPVAVSVNELDPLRDEGMQLYRNLRAAGVAARGRVSMGTVHGGEFFCAGSPAYHGLIGDMTSFVDCL